MSLSGLAYASLEQSLNSYLGLDPIAQKKMAQLHGKVIAFEIEGLGQTLYFIPGPAQLQILSVYEGDPDCTIQGPPFALARMGDEQASSEQLFDGAVVISGDTVLALRVSKVIEGMNIDWEALLARYTGSIIAEDVAGLFKQAHQFGTRTLTAAGLDIQELLEKELRLLPGKVELENFLNGVDTLRDDAERLQARINLLKQQGDDV